MDQLPTKMEFDRGDEKLDGENDARQVSTLLQIEEKILGPNGDT